MKDHDLARQFFRDYGSASSHLLWNLLGALVAFGLAFTVYAIWAIL